MNRRSRRKVPPGRVGDRRIGRCGGVRAALVAVVAVGVSACGLQDVGGAADGGAVGLFESTAAFAGVESEPRATASSAFWDHWGDGRAELGSYRVVTSRYGARREGELVLIYVTEPHDRRTWIKDDAAEAPNRAEVMKLNVSLKFMTGIYPYSVMTSVFSPVDDRGGERFRPVKISMSAQEWCGNVHRQVWPGSGAFRSVLLSYFSDEGEHLREEEVPAGALYEDGLPIQLREPDGSFADGGDWRGWIVPSLWNVRRGVAPLEAVRGEIVRSEGVDAEGREVTRFTLRYGDYRRTFEIEAEAPRRLLKWTTSVGDTVTLVESRRMPYWELNDPEGRAARTELGLDPAASGRPPTAPAE